MVPTRTATRGASISPWTLYSPRRLSPRFTRNSRKGSLPTCGPWFTIGTLQATLSWGSSLNPLGFRKTIGCLTNHTCTKDDGALPSSLCFCYNKKINLIVYGKIADFSVYNKKQSSKILLGPWFCLNILVFLLVLNFV